MVNEMWGDVKGSVNRIRILFRARGDDVVS